VGDLNFLTETQAPCELGIQLRGSYPRYRV